MSPDELALRLFAAWCGTTPEHAATRDAWRKGQASHYTRDGWKRVAEAAQAACAETTREKTDTKEAGQ